MQPIAVDCLFREDGTILVRRIMQDGQWHAVEQGRQWQDGAGRHVLVMLDGRQVHELVLNSESLIWEFRSRQRSGATVV